MPDATLPASWEELSRLFAELLEVEESAERDAVLAASCVGRPGLEAELRSMLAAVGDEAALGVEGRLLAAVEDDVLPAGTVVGGYRLLRLLGRGGMGEVHLAERLGGDFEQRVALKLVRAGGLAPDLDSRLRAERRILARLAHPLIVPLLDGGVADDGRPFLVMQYVDGTPVDRYCRERGASLRERVRLLVQVCRAVQHAHAALVVHRDLKPSNLLVTADGEPRLLDFGVAKLLAADGEGDATRPHLAWMTPRRAAPEQLAGLPVSTATDVWGLGVLLVELAAEGLPEVEDASFEAARAALRRTAEALPGDLGRIAGKALALDPGERYASADQLGDDLERYLAGRPVVARPGRWSYRAARFVQRNLPAVAATTAAVVALVAFAAVSTVQARRLAVERDRVAEEEARSRAVVDLLVDLFEEADPAGAADSETLDVARFLAAAETRVARLEAQPELQARMEQVLGEIEHARSRFAAARRLYSRAHARRLAIAGPADPAALELEGLLAWTLFQGGERAEAEARLLDLLPRIETALGAEHQLVSETLQRLSVALPGAAGAAYAERALALERRRDPPDRSLLAGALAAVASLHVRAGDRAAAAPLYREAAVLREELHGPAHPHTLVALSNLAASLADPAEQEAVYRRLLPPTEALFGRESAPVANRTLFLGIVILRQGELAAAEKVLRQARDLWSSVGGRDHPRTAQAEGYLARIEELSGRRDEARRRLERTLGTARSPAVDDPLLLAAVLAALSRLDERDGRFAEAVQEAAEAVAALDGPRGNDAARADARLALGLALLGAGRADEAEAPLREAAVLREAAGRPRAEIAEAGCALARLHAALGRDDEAAALRQRHLSAFAAGPLAHPADVAACGG